MHVSRSGVECPVKISHAFLTCSTESLAQERTAKSESSLIMFDNAFSLYEAFSLRLGRHSIREKEIYFHTFMSTGYALVNAYQAVSFCIS